MIQDTMSGLDLEKLMPGLDLDRAKAKVAEIKIEPWMFDFVKDRHTQEEWDAFWVYCEAGPWKRRLMRCAGIWARVIGLI